MQLYSVCLVTQWAIRAWQQRGDGPWNSQSGKDVNYFRQEYSTERVDTVNTFNSTVLRSLCQELVLHPTGSPPSNDLHLDNSRIFVKF